jgi:hypothetical protein
VTAKSGNNITRAKRAMPSSDSEITFPIQLIAENELLPGNKLLNTRFPWQPPGQQREINCPSWCLPCASRSGYKMQWIRKFTRRSIADHVLQEDRVELRSVSVCKCLWLWVCVYQWVIEREREGERVSQCVWMSEWINAWEREWVCVCVCVCVVG